MLIPTPTGNNYLGISILDTAPKDTEFTPLADHAASTPASFSLDTDPVLHYNLPLATLRILGDGFSLLPAPLTASSLPPDISAEAGLPCEVKIASSRLFLWFPAQDFGYAIAYPSITLHGIASSTSIYLQVAASTDETEFAELYLDTPDSQPVYDALCTCAGLHADPDSEEEGNGGIALDLDVDMDLGLEDYEAGGDDDGWTKGGHVAAENEEEGVGRAGLEIAIEDDDVRAGVRRRRSEGGEDVASNGTDKPENDGSAEKWRRTS